MLAMTTTGKTATVLQGTKLMDSKRFYTKLLDSNRFYTKLMESNRFYTKLRE